MTPPPFEARVAPGKSLALALLGLGMSAASWALLMIGSLVATVTGVVGGIFFLACAGVIARQALDRDLQIRIDHAGIYWKRWSPETIPWRAVRDVCEVTIQSQRFMSVWLHVPGKYRGRGLLGQAARANRSLGFGDLALSMQGLNRSHAELVEATTGWFARGGAIGHWSD